MASKQVTEPGIGDIHLYKRKGARSIRLSITPKGMVRVTMPHWVPFHAGLTFARGRKDWILEHTAKSSQLLAHGQAIGKNHRLVFEVSPVLTKASARVSDNLVRVTHPAACAVSDISVQAAAEKGGIRALRNQAEALLPGRLRQLAELHGFDYRSVQVKQMTGRWGSCDSQRNIVLNLFLMELPWTLIDYVLLHELTHTNVMKHGPQFWSAMADVLPDVQVRRKAMKLHRPVLGASA